MNRKAQTEKNDGSDFSKPPYMIKSTGKWLLYDGFFSLAVVRQSFIYFVSFLQH
jgi:hypothetical protein